MNNRVRRIQLMRRLRSDPEPAGPISDLVESVAAAAHRAHRRTSSLVDIWEAMLPEDLASRCRIDTVRRGVAHVLVDSPATAFEIDRRLRGGLLDALRAAFTGTLVRVKMKVGVVDPDGLA